MSKDRHDWTLRFGYPVVRWIVWLILLVFGAPMRGINRRRVPRRGPLLIFSNHISNCDPILLQWSCPRLVHFMARRELWTMGFLGNVLQWWKAFPVTQSSADKGAIKRAIELVHAGHAVCIFPEGQLSPTGDLIELLPGCSLIVRKTEATCICVGLRHSNALMPYPDTKPRWAGAILTGTWGEPRKFSRDSSQEEIMGWVESELLRLTGQPQREVPAHPEPAPTQPEE